MKKSLVALAVLASFAGVASAQSSVSIYGIADVWAGRTKVEVPGVASVSTSVLNSGGLSTSRLGFTGTEDLGGGLSAVFRLEGALSIDNGTAGGVTFNRQSYVGLAGGFGEVVFGRPWTAFDDIAGAANSVWDASTFAVEYSTWLSSLYNANPANGIKYTSPDFGGFSGAVSYSLDENPAADLNVTAFHVKYNGGPLYVGLGYQTEGTGAGTPDAKFTRLNGTYDFGAFQLLAGYGQLKIDAAKTTDLSIAANFPLSNAVNLSVGYARSKDNEFLGDSKRDGFTIGATYGLSKRTTAYAIYTTADQTTPGLGKTLDINAFGVGVRHSF